MPTWSMRWIVTRSTLAQALDQQRHTRVSGTLTMPAGSSLFARVYL